VEVNPKVSHYHLLNALRRPLVCNPFLPLFNVLDYINQDPHSNVDLNGLLPLLIKEDALSHD
jgi:hypothetical protein